MWSIVINYNAKKILVTGGSGFIGSNYIHHKLRCDLNVEIVNLDLLTYAANSDNLESLVKEPRYRFVQGNICDGVLILDLLREFNIDTVIHFAAESHVDRSIKNPADFVLTNVFGTYTLLDAARKFWLEEKKLSKDKCRFHHISTDEVFGSLNCNEAAFTETRAYQPNSPYSASKASSDHFVRAYHHTYGLPTTLSNCSNNYGPFQHPEKFIPTVIRACVEQKTIPIYGDGSNIRDWLYVLDHCSAIDTIIQQGRLGETYNVGGCNEISNIDLAQKICGIFNRLFSERGDHNHLIDFVTDRAGHDWRYAINNHKISTELNWHPQYSFEAALSATIDFYLHYFA